ncbi:MAG: heme A synthase [Ekhidna sp.]
MLSRKFFLKINVITLGSVFVLILVGSIVRSLGAGMGCPDWPKCFGSYIPPTSSEDLPDNYLDIFRDQRIKKNERLAQTMASLGYTQLSERITNDPNVLVEQPFDVTKAWIEYINRLVGVLIGLFVTLNMISGLSFWKKDWLIAFLGIFIFVLTAFQGWVGSLVVSTNLLHGFITFHMVLALLIVALLIWMNVRARELSSVRNTKLFVLSWGCFVLFIPQIFLGTDVRGIVDDMIFNNTGRSVWVSAIQETSFFIHRSYSWLILIGAVTIFYFARQSKDKTLLPTAMQLVTLIFMAMLAGIGMTRFDFPFWLQPLHLIFATGIFSLLFYLTLRLKKS